MKKSKHSKRKNKIDKPCVAPNCLTQSSSNVGFYNFPGDKVLREKWKDFCGVAFSEYLCKKYKLCAVHFSPDSFNTEENYNNLSVNRILKKHGNNILYS